MNVPIKFPRDAHVIAGDAARFRALSAQERLAAIHGLLEAGALIMRNSPNPEFWRAYTLEQEDHAHQAIKEFIARHAR